MVEQLEGTFFMKTIDGKEIILENARVTELTVDENKDYSDFNNNFIYQINNRCYEMSIKVKSINKKRFKKLLMSKGMQRNEAEEMTKYILRKYGNYNPIYLLLF